jgi:peptide/nickel transport system permease protein
MKAYWRYLSGRIVLLLVTVFISITVVFFVPRLVPGDPLNSIMIELSRAGSNRGASELIEEYRRIFGMDRSVWEQYISFIRELLRGNLGYSISNFPSQVSDLIRASLPWTSGC